MVGFAYGVIRALFRVVAFVFYHNVHVEGQQNVPPRGTPALLCFNHGNGLGDSIVMISACDRVVRVAAKDTLWKIPFVGHLIRWSGAVPVMRHQDHEDGKVDNTAAFEAIFRVLESGNMIGIAPEGISRFHSQLAPLKSGVARIAFEAVRRNVGKDPNFRVLISACGLTYLHRAHWRSDVCVEIAEPIVVDAKFIESLGGNTKEAQAKLMEMVLNKLSQCTLNAPDWETLTLAITCTRLFAPFGTNISLGEYVSIVRHFVKILGSSTTQQYDEVDVTELRTQLREYQQALKSCRIKDNRIRRVALDGFPSNANFALRITIRGLICTVLFALSLPGMVLWAPTCYLTRQRESQLISRSVENYYDTVMENSALIGFVVLQLTCFSCGVGAALVTANRSQSSVFGTQALKMGLGMCLVVAPSLLWMTVRWVEDGVASLRSIISLWRLCFMDKKKLKALVYRRGILEAKVAKVAVATSAPQVIPQKSRRAGGAWAYFSLRSRRKKDWHEVLRLTDTIDYDKVGKKDKWFAEFTLPLED